MNRQLLSLFVFTLSLLQAQKPKQLNSAEIYHELEKLNVLASVLYVAAHPDDENTKLISYFANDVKARTAYLSLTRGDGGQNLIGPELRELLGVIRTQELIQARKVDGGYQFFTRANDFGFSKVPDETLQIWNKKEVIEDMAYVIRQWKPDIIVNRFDHRSPGTTHGHHTTSALLMMELFDQLNRSDFYPSQVEKFGTWQPQRLFFNTSWWFYGSREKFNQADKSNLVAVEVGKYFQTLGTSNQEIAALSRSQHQSQGFGSTANRGDETEYLEILKGSKPENYNLFQGIDISWNRVKNGAQIGELVTKLLQNFDFKQPSKSISGLLEIRQKILNLEDSHWKNIKLKEVDNVIEQILGVFVEGFTTDAFATPGDEVNIRLEALNRSDLSVKIKNIRSSFSSQIIAKEIQLKNNQPWIEDTNVKIPNTANFTVPYWLTENGSEGMYNITNPLYTGLADTPRDFKLFYELEIDNQSISYQKTIVYKYNDRVKGEVYQPFDILPAVSLQWNQKVSLFFNNKPQNISFSITANQSDVKGTIRVVAPNGWKIQPSSFEVSEIKKNQTQNFTIQVSPTLQDITSEITLQFEGHQENFNKEVVTISYDHIPHQKVLLPSKTVWSQQNIKIGKERIAYVMGAGDEVPNYIQTLGYEVQVWKGSDITEENLAKIDVLITGIRAFNTDRDLVNKRSLWMQAIANGKKMIVQYNTSDVLSKEIGPYPFQISRDRVTEEQAEVTFLLPNHSMLQSPNKLNKNDFSGWVQELGLYFPNTWDDKYQALFAANDLNETPKKGMLLTTNYGKGTFIYTGLSFFRQLPAGVPGAYKLIANMISSK